MIILFHYTKSPKNLLTFFSKRCYNGVVINLFTERMIPMATHEELVSEVKNLVAAPSVYSGLKDLAEKWLAAEGTAAQANLTALLRAALKEDVCTIDQVLPFFASDEAKKAFGEEQAAKMLAQGQKVKAEGGKYCFCPACTAGAKILEMLGD